MPSQSDDIRLATLSHMQLRRFIGLIGLGTPFVLLLGVIIGYPPDGRIWGSSLSAHYWAPYLGSVFVGALCATGVFLLFYKGYPRNQDEHYFGKGRFALADFMARHVSDAHMARAAGVGALVTALLPVCGPDGPCSAGSFARVAQLLHLGGAALFLVSLSWIAFFHFTRTRESPEHWDEASAMAKHIERMVHATLGVIMFLCLASIVVVFRLFPDVKIAPGVYGPIFWLEALAIWAFGASWLLKGAESGGILRRMLGMQG